MCLCVCINWYQSKVFIIEKLNYLNLEVNTGKIISTEDHIDIRCRLNHSKGHSWHTSQSQLNLIVDLLYNFFITWGKRQEELEVKFERANKEYNLLSEQYSLLNKNLTSALEILKEERIERIKLYKNIDYIKEEVNFVYKKLDSKVSIKKETVSVIENTEKFEQNITQVKELIEEVRKLVLS